MVFPLLPPAMISRPFSLAFLAAASLWIVPASARPPEAAPAAAAEPSPGPVADIVYRNDESDTTAQGLANQPQFSGCGYLYNGANNELGTGTAIAANWVVTAKHVVTGYTTATFHAANGQVISGTVTTDSDTDMALIKLDTPLITTSGQAYTPVALITPNLPGAPKVQPVGPLIWNVGYGNYGQVGVAATGLDYKRRGGTNVVNNYSGSILYFTNENTGGTEFESSTGSGDSGGPMYLQTGYQWRIAAVVFGTGNDPKANNVASFTDTDLSNNPFITNMTGIAFVPQAAPTSLTWNATYLSPSTAASKNITNFADGAGNWDTTRLNFVGATSGGDTYTYAWQNATLLPVTFGHGSGTAGVVTVTTPINVSDLVFATTGGGAYQIAGSGTNGLTLAAAGSSVTVNPGVPAPLISAPLAGTSALTKLGAGGLVLGGTNTYTGGTNVNAGGLQLNVQGALGTSGNIAVASGATLNAGPLGTTGYALAAGRTLTDNGSVTGALSVSGSLTGAGTVGTNSNYALTVNASGLLLGTTGTLTIYDALTNNGTISMPSGATLDASMAGPVTNNGALNLVDGNLKLPANSTFTNGTNGTVTDAGGTLTLTGSVLNNGTIRVTGGAVLDASMVSNFTNNGTLDLIDGSAKLPAGPNTGSGVILTKDLLRIKTTTRTSTAITLTVDGYTGHNYQLQRGTSPDGTSFVNLGSAQAGSTGTTLTFTDPSPASDRGFYRVVLVP